MRLFNALVFDDLISGDELTWYSSAELNEQLGRAEILAIQACTTGVAAGSHLTVQVETSADNKNWLPTAAPPEIDKDIDNDESYVGVREDLTLLGNVRLKINLGDSGDACRLKLYVTGRALAGRM